MELIDSRSKKRAARTLRCLPFNFNFYADARQSGLTAEKIFQKAPKYCVEGTRWFKHPNAVEEAFRWLIRVGVLRREVDGQGLTSKIRLTPLGREILVQNPKLPEGKANFFEKMLSSFWANWLLR